MRYLDWSLADLRRICALETPVAQEASAAANSSPLLDIVDELRRDADVRTARVLLVIDQFEELLGQVGTGGDRWGQASGPIIS